MKYLTTDGQASLRVGHLPEDLAYYDPDASNQSIPARFEKQVEKTPNHIAIKYRDYILSYDALNKKANQIARAILTEGGEGNQPIALLFEFGVMSIVAIYAALKAGKIVVSLDPSNLFERLEYFMDDSQAKILVSNQENLPLATELAKGGQKVINVDQLDENLSDENLDLSISADDLAVIIYTSGSTGMPKGVMQTHRSIHHRAFGITPEDHVSHMFSTSFGGIVPDVYGTLLSGGTLYPYNIAEDGFTGLASWLIEEEISIFHPSVSAIRQLNENLDRNTRFPKLRIVDYSGWAIYTKDVIGFQKFCSPDCVSRIALSASEVGRITQFFFDSSSKINSRIMPVGYPCVDKEILIVDENGKELGFDRPGEIAVSGPYISPGYWRDEALTKKKFLSIEDKIVYLTGDMGRMRPDGLLEHLGRKDFQTKIRGHRVAIPEVEAAIQELDVVDEVVVKAVAHPKSEEIYLAAYLVSTAQPAPTVRYFRNVLSNKLPTSMIPSRFVMMEKLPLTRTGKVDRNALPDPGSERPDLGTPYVAPRNKLEKQIVSVWEGLTGVEPIGVEDNFFDLGGDSLMALELSLEIERHLSVELPQEFFRDPTIASLVQLFKAKDSQAETRKDFFHSSFSRKPEESPKHRRAGRFGSRVIRKIYHHKFSLDDLNRFHRLTEKIVAGYLVRMPYEEAQAWAVKWSHSAFVRQVFYRRRQALFAKWLAVLSQGGDDLPGDFQLNLLNNMFFRLPKPVSKYEKGTIDFIEAYRNSPYPYWRSLGELIATGPVEELGKKFPIKRLEILEEAYQQGKGVILLSFHGTPGPGGVYPLARMLGIKDIIPTVSYQIPLRQSRLHNQRASLPETTASALNAEIALYGQRKLQEGKIVNFASDTDDIRGKTYKISMGGRTYQMKAGFAEMALNTGAMVVPFSRFCLPNGRVQMELHAPFQVAGGGREHQVEKMLQDYTDFIDQSWRAHPEALSWDRISRHLNRPPSEE